MSNFFRRKKERFAEEVIHEIIYGKFMIICVAPQAF